MDVDDFDDVDVVVRSLSHPLSSSTSSSSSFSFFSLLFSVQSPQTDKLTILYDSIKLIATLRQQNYQLRELNKYLQERIAKNESSNHYQYYHHMMAGGAYVAESRQGHQPQPSALGMYGAPALGFPGNNKGVGGFPPLAPAAIAADTPTPADGCYSRSHFQNLQVLARPTVAVGGASTCHNTSTNIGHANLVGLGVPTTAIAPTATATATPTATAAGAGAGAGATTTATATAAGDPSVVEAGALRMATTVGRPSTKAVSPESNAATATGGVGAVEKEDSLFPPCA